VIVWDALLDRRDLRDLRPGAGATDVSADYGNGKKRRNRDKDWDERRQTQGRKCKHHETLLEH
jgi:hypothetical protein